MNSEIKIGKSIKHFRKLRGLKQYQLAERIGISSNALCMVEKDQNFPHQGTVKKICEVLDIPADYLMLYSVKLPDVVLQGSVDMMKRLISEDVKSFCK